MKEQDYDTWYKEYDKHRAIIGTLLSSHGHKLQREHLTLLAKQAGLSQKEIDEVLREEISNGIGSRWAETASGLIWVPFALSDTEWPE